jgi:hypothetical protein
LFVCEKKSSDGMNEERKKKVQKIIYTLYTLISFLLKYPTTNKIIIFVLLNDNDDDEGRKGKGEKNRVELHCIMQ